ncbi:hypothetical protein CARUB_v10015666mg [Capsella rubella]|uniref:Gnk2-homologous domain-containing protein n=1 Tax=Capsella rubella TaxID=81985 RepID=R0I377_9BRAS|nr:cysteine-rich repeat secretory protein 34 [Capsella rubella]EOA32395.1 hypothetical protein CARUB_v10015666mg [Capsella rubella]
MYYSCSLLKHLVYLHVLAIQLFFIGNVASLNLTNDYLHHKCRINQGKYQSGSEYEKNLNSLTRDLSTNKFPTGFIHISNGEPPNYVTIIFQCRGDSHGPNCRSCFSTAVAGFHRRCSRNKGGIIWYDQCFLDVSMINDRMPRKLNYENTFPMHNPNNVREDTKAFDKKTRDFLYKLIAKADKPDKDGVNFLYYAAEEMRIGTNKVYAMVQCAKDIQSCKVCLEWSIKELSKCCGGKKGARILGTSCNIRYELYPFIRTYKTL